MLGKNHRPRKETNSMRRAYVFHGFEDHDDGLATILAVIEAKNKEEAKEKFEKLHLKTEPIVATDIECVLGEENIKKARKEMEREIEEKYDYIGFLQKELEVLQFNRKRLKETGNF